MLNMILKVQRVTQMWDVPLPYLWSTTIVPPFKNLEKTKGTPVPLEYHYSTSISEVDPYSKTNQIQNYT